MTVVGQDKKMLGECWKTIEQLCDERENYDKMLKYAGKYQISIQFWGDGDTNVFIEKDGVELRSFGGLNPADAIEETVKYLNRINRIKD